MTETPVSDKKKSCANKNMKATGIGVALGAGIGTAIGAATGNMGLWMTLGAGIGTAIGAAISLSSKT